MNIMQKLHHIQLADFRERTRRYSFLVMLGIIIFLSFFTIPPIHQKGKAIRLVLNNEYRAVYNSAFIGNAIVILVVMMLSLFGFYLVKNSIERDYNTGVGQIIATTPTSKILYLLGKMISNFFVLAVMVCVIALVAFIMNIVRGETAVNLWQLFAPFLIIALPSILLISAMSVLFEVIPFLRGSLGNILYFFIWSTLITLDMSNAIDIFGLGVITERVSSICPNGSGGLNWCFCEEHSIKSILWEGIDWNLEILTGRFVWIVISIGIVLLASVFFNRFDSYKNKKEVKKKNNKKFEPSIEKTSEVVNPQVTMNLNELTSVPIRFNFFNMVKSELCLMFKGLSWWWKLVAVGLIIGCVFSPLQIAQDFIFPFAWLWPIAIWSSMGSKEKRYNIEQIVFSCEHYVQRHQPSVFLAGTIVSLIMGSGMLIRLIIMNNFKGLAMFILASMFIPALSLALGSWTRNNKLFEVLYMLIWYFGPINHIEILNFANVIDCSLFLIKAPIYFMATMILFVLAILGGNMRAGNVK